jgi:hypothetical protein
LNHFPAKTKYSSEEKDLAFFKKLQQDLKLEEMCFGLSGRKSEANFATLEKVHEFYQSEMQRAFETELEESFEHVRSLEVFTEAGLEELKVALGKKWSLYQKEKRLDNSPFYHYLTYYYQEESAASLNTINYK